MKIDLDRLHYDFLIPGHIKTTSRLIETVQNLYFEDSINIVTLPSRFYFIKNKILEIIKDNPQLGFHISRVFLEKLN